MAELHLDGPLRAWHDTAYAAKWTDGPMTQPVMIFLGPEGGSHPAQAASEWVGKLSPGLATLQRVVPIRARWATVYPRLHALGLIHLLPKTDSDGIPMRCAAELVAQVAETVHRLGPAGLRHHGPSFQDIGLDAEGQTHLVGFVGLWPPDATLDDPMRGRPDAVMVWRLGLLLAQLVGGRVPALDSRENHQAGLRRILIRAMSRQGASLTERYRDYLSGMLAWEPSQRPPLSSISKGLRSVAQKMNEPDLTSWAMEAVPPKLDRTHTPTADHSQTSTLLDAITEPADSIIGEATGRLSLPRLQTLPGVDLAALRDEQTVEAGVVPGPRDGSQRAGHEPGIIPVTVGPPAEALRSRPSLPPGFLSGIQRETPPEPSATRTIVWLVVATLAGISLMLMGLLLAVSMQA